MHPAIYRDRLARRDRQCTELQAMIRSRDMAVTLIQSDQTCGNAQCWLCERGNLEDKGLDASANGTAAKQQRSGFVGRLRRCSSGNTRTD